MRRIPFNPPVLLRTYSVGLAVGISALWTPIASATQPTPVDYLVTLSSATVYDTRSPEEDTIHTAMAVFVNGERRGSAIWDGKGWDGSRPEGRRWVTGLHQFGPSSGSTVHVPTGPLADTDTLEIVFHVVSSEREPSTAEHEAVFDRIHRSACKAPAASSVWECLASEVGDLLAGWPLTSCDGLVAADKLSFPAAQLRKQTETGSTVTAGHRYRGTPAPQQCSGGSIYAAMLSIARR